MSNGNARRSVSIASGVINIQDTGNIVVADAVAFTDGDTTPTILAGRFFKTANTSGTTITDFDDVSTDGYEIFIMINDALTTIAHNSNIKLPAKLSTLYAQYDAIKFVMFGGVWYGSDWRMN